MDVIVGEWKKGKKEMYIFDMVLFVSHITDEIFGKMNDTQE